MVKNLYIKVVYWVLGCSFLLLFSCAKQGSPSGGPKDTESPEVTDAEPQSGTVNFDQDHFDIQFNEYVQLNNIQQNLIVSPPFSKKPEVKLRGKAIRVVLPEKPQPNTTYSFTFLDAISDITERNTIKSLVYAFSSGPEIDSLRVSGAVKDAFTDDPVADVYVMLHSNPADSMFRKHVPDYLTKTNEQGKFKFFYLSPGAYKIYALDDANYSSTFDQPNENIAFLDSLIVPGVEPEKDSADSIIGYNYFPDGLKLRLFEQAKYLQFLKANERPQSNQIQIFFEHPQDSILNWHSPEFDSSQVVTEASEYNDSIVFWLTDTSLCRKDSLQIIIDYYSKVDSIGWTTDSLMMTSKSDFDEEKLDVDVNLEKSELNYWEMPEITIKSVINKINSDSIHLFHRINDSVKKAVDFDIERINKRRFRINAKFTQGKNYALVFDTIAIEDVLYRHNDSTAYEFSVNEEGDFSTLKVSIPGTDSGWYCDLLQNDKTLRRKTICDDGTFTMQHLVPGSYQLRLVRDINKNRKWDTGDFDKKQQPEKVWYKAEKIELRANWTQETEWHVFEEHYEEKNNE